MIQRGEIWWVDLADPGGSAPGFRRPVVVIQSDGFNRSRIETIVTVALTSNLRLAEAPGNVVLSKRESGLPKDSVANVSQLVTLDRAEFEERVGALRLELLREIERGLRLVLGL